MTSSWLLKKENTIFGQLTLEEVDQPWFMCSFKRDPAFTQIAPLFELVQKQLNAPKIHFPENSSWDNIYEEIEKLGLVLVAMAPEEDTFDEFLLHIQGDKAWFRR